MQPANGSKATVVESNSIVLGLRWEERWAWWEWCWTSTCSRRLCSTSPSATTSHRQSWEHNTLSSARPLAQLVLYTTMQPDMAPYGHFLLDTHKETKVPHTPGLQYNDPHHHIHNSMMHKHSTVCSCFQILSESSLTTFKFRLIIQEAPRYPNWLLRNNAPIVWILLISRNLVWVNSLLKWQMHFLHPHLGLENRYF